MHGLEFFEIRLESRASLSGYSRERPLPCQPGVETRGRRTAHWGYVLVQSRRAQMPAQRFYAASDRGGPRNPLPVDRRPSTLASLHPAAAVPFREPTRQPHSLPTGLPQSGNSGAARLRLQVSQPPTASQQARVQGKQPPMRRRDSPCHPRHDQPLLLHKMKVPAYSHQRPPF